MVFTHLHVFQPYNVFDDFLVLFTNQTKQQRSHNYRNDTEKVWNCFKGPEPDKYRDIQNQMLFNATKPRDFCDFNFLHAKVCNFCLRISNQRMKKCTRFHSLMCSSSNINYTHHEIKPSDPSKPTNFRFGVNSDVGNDCRSGRSCCFMALRDVCGLWAGLSVILLDLIIIIFILIIVIIRAEAVIMMLTVICRKRTTFSTNTAFRVSGFFNSQELKALACKHHSGWCGFYGCL